ncbi:galectin-4-like isoform X2 [Pleurodeles waltl]|uniref:galectin-4-like isoform X2 n=1 Tax=Pleurodeles waltl TaxID=8319 RepID=UPI003709A389
MECALVRGSQPIYNPPIPFCSRIDGGLRVGMSVYIQGKVPHHAERFHINFRSGQSDDSDIALHFNPRFNWFSKVVFNSFEGGSWSSEEKKAEMPFQKGEHFEVVFIVKQDSYQVNVNGGSFYEFMHRIPLERVEFLQVAGDVTIESIKFGAEAGGFGSNVAITGGGMMPDPSYNPAGVPGDIGMSGYQPGNAPGGMNMPGDQPGNVPGTMPNPSYAPAEVPYGGMAMPGYQSGNTIPIPYCGNIFGGLSPEQTIVIRGFIPNGASRADINFLVGCSREIALHISLRMAEKRVVRNSFLKGSWGVEEVELTYNPFAHGERFDISVRCGNSCFQVYVNGQHLFNYDHRVRDFQQIDLIEIDGDVVLSSVQP